MASGFIEPGVPGAKAHFEESLRRAISLELAKLGEFAIEQAIEDFRAKARARLAEMCMALVRHDYEISRQGSTLIIKVDIGGEEDGAPPQS